MGLFGDVVGGIGDLAGSAWDSTEGKAADFLGDRLAPKKDHFSADPYQPDRGNFQYGGRAGGADEDSAKYWGRSQAAGSRGTGQHISNPGNGIFGTSEDMSQARMRDALSLQRDAANGLVPSQAQLQMRQAMDANNAAASSAAASARGPAGLAMAQQNAMAQNAMNQQRTAADTAALRAGEMAQARGAYMQGAGALNDAAARRLGMEQNFQLGKTQAEIAGRSADDRAALGWAGLESGVRQSQLGADMGYNQSQQAGYQNAQNINAGVSAANAAADRDQTKNMLGMFGQATGGAGNAAGAMMGPLAGLF